MPIIGKESKVLVQKKKEFLFMADQINTIKTRFAPFRCPVCNGHKTVNYGKLPCDTCKATGVILVDQEKGEIHNPSKI